MTIDELLNREADWLAEDYKELKNMASNMFTVQHAFASGRCAGVYEMLELLMDELDELDLEEQRCQLKKSPKK